jgi:hypothetical protein
MSTKLQTAMKAGTVMFVLLFTTGCYSGLQNQVDELQAKVDRLSAEVAADDVIALAAQDQAAAAQATADEALVIAVESQACCDATNEKIDRMFQRSQSK